MWLTTGTWENSVLPLLEERFFGDPGQLRRFDLDRLRTGTPEPPDSGTQGPAFPGEP
jgi:hypothetical protein